MTWNLMFFINNILLGLGLAMDAFSVSVANGLNEPNMKGGKVIGIATIFGLFQGIMPLIGWVCVHYLIEYFENLNKFVPYIALILLLFIGIKMIVDGVKNKKFPEEALKQVGFWGLIVQGIATSIDALSVGFTIAEYGALMAVISALIITIITFVMCIIGVYIGKKFGNRLSYRASIIGGVILILIGIEIFLTGILG